MKCSVMVNACSSFVPVESVYVSLSVRVQEVETAVNTGSKCISVNVMVKAK